MRPGDNEPRYSFIYEEHVFAVGAYTGQIIRDGRKGARRGGSA